MRTTLNLDEDVARPLTELAKQSRRSLSRVANDLLRTGLREKQRAPKLKAYTPAVFESGRPLVDVTDVAEALEVLEHG